MAYSQPWQQGRFGALKLQSIFISLVHFELQKDLALSLCTWPRLALHGVIHLAGFVTLITTEKKRRTVYEQKHGEENEASTHSNIGNSR